MKLNFLAKKADRDEYLIASTIKPAEFTRHLEGEKTRKAEAAGFLKGTIIGLFAGGLTGFLAGLAW